MYNIFDGFCNFQNVQIICDRNQSIIFILDFFTLKNVLYIKIKNKNVCSRVKYLTEIINDDVKM